MLNHSHPIQFLPWNDNEFILQSQKDGYNHLYLFNKDGRQLKQITSGKWVVIDVLGFNNKQKSIVYVSNECNPIQRNTWLVNVGSGKRTLLDNGRGYHYPKLSEDGNAVMDSYSEPSVPHKYEVISLTGKPQRHDYLSLLQTLGKDIQSLNIQVDLLRQQMARQTYTGVW